MAAYAVFEPPMRGRSTADHTDRFVFVREGFNFWAFLFGVLWILWRRLWLALIIYVVVVGFLQFGLLRLGISTAGRTLVTVLIHFLIGMEAATLRRWTLVRRGWREWGIVIADDLEMAERRFFDRRSARMVVARPAATPTAPSPAAPPPAGESVIGLFPEPGGGG